MALIIDTIYNLNFHELTFVVLFLRAWHEPYMILNFISITNFGLLCDMWKIMSFFSKGTMKSENLVTWK